MRVRLDKQMKKIASMMKLYRHCPSNQPITTDIEREKAQNRVQGDQYPILTETEDLLLNELYPAS